MYENIKINLNKAQIFIVDQSDYAYNAIKPFSAKHNLSITHYTSAEDPDLHQRYQNPAENVIMVIIHDNLTCEKDSNGFKYGMDAIELLKYLKSQAIYPQILIFSQNKEIHNAVKAIQLGASDYLINPSKEELVNHIKKLLDHAYENIKNAENKQKIKTKSNKTKILIREYELKRYLENKPPLTAIEKSYIEKLPGPKENLTWEDCLYKIQGENQINKSQPNVLIVEDDPDVMFMNYSRLKKRYQTYQAETGEIALQQLKKHPEIDVMLLDIYLPGKNGDELIEDFHKINPNLEIVVLTAYQEVPLAVKTQMSGAYYFLTKSESKEKIFEKIDEAYLQKCYKDKYSDEDIPLERRIKLFQELIRKRTLSNKKINHYDLITFFPEINSLKNQTFDYQNPNTLIKQIKNLTKTKL